MVQNGVVACGGVASVNRWREMLRKRGTVEPAGGCQAAVLGISRRQTLQPHDPTSESRWAAKTSPRTLCLAHKPVALAWRQRPSFRFGLRLPQPSLRSQLTPAIYGQATRVRSRKAKIAFQKCGENWCGAISPDVNSARDSAHGNSDCLAHRCQACRDSFAISRKTSFN